MRVLALLLILANVCFWFWAHYVDVPDSLPVAKVIAPAQAPPRLVLANERPDAAQQAAAITNQLSCVSVGPFVEDDEWQAAAKRLEDAGFTSTERQTEGDIFAGYWVSLSGFATKADAEQALLRLRTAGIADAFVMADEAAPNVISLGLYAEQAHAEQRRDAIAKLGFSPELQNRMRRGPVHWLDVALQEPGQLIDPAVLQPKAAGISRLETRACPPPSQASAASQESQSSVSAPVVAKK
jgi:hypothetical protein